MRRFVLFDIDGTLIRPGARIQRTHMSAMAEAITAVTGARESFRYVGGKLYYGDMDCAGFTDAGTICAALAGHGIPTGEIDTLADIVANEMQRRVVRSGVAGVDGSDDDCLLPGCGELVRTLVEGGVQVGLSTGNAPEVARWKMRRAGLADLLHHGGFGHRLRDRRDVVSSAVTTMTGGEQAAGLLIGDTTADVRAAHHAGLCCVAVATGEASAEVLRMAGPDAVVADLTAPGLPGLIFELLATSKLTAAVSACGDEKSLHAR